MNLSSLRDSNDGGSCWALNEFQCLKGVKVSWLLLSDLWDVSCEENLFLSQRSFILFDLHAFLSTSLFFLLSCPRASCFGPFVLFYPCPISVSLFISVCHLWNCLPSITKMYGMIKGRSSHAVDSVNYVAESYNFNNAQQKQQHFNLIIHHLSLSSCFSFILCHNHCLSQRDWYFAAVFNRSCSVQPPPTQNHSDDDPSISHVCSQGPLPFLSYVLLFTRFPFSFAWCRHPALFSLLCLQLSQSLLCFHSLIICHAKLI